MANRLSLPRRLALVAAITVILAVFSSLILSVGMTAMMTVSSHAALWEELIPAATIFSGFALIFIAACMPVIVLPAILIGMRMGWLHSLRSTLALSLPVGLGCALLTTGWLLGDGMGWLILIALGAGCGLLGGSLWWRWIGVHEIADQPSPADSV